MTLLYFDCTSGAAGDMVLAALIDAGAPEEVVRASLDALDLPGWTMTIGHTTKNGLRASRAQVTIESEPARGYSEIQALLQDSGLSDGVRRRALDTFARLAEAEARVHGVAVDAVHLHEIGATDALIDIVAASAALEHLAPERVVTSAIATGTGVIESSHGPLPLPAPAVGEILKDAVMFGRGNAELVTPTGAAILAAATDSFGEMPAMRLEAVGYGAGAADLDWPNVVRVFVGVAIESDADEDTLLVETNIDDMSPELFPHVIEALVAAGARDAWITPILMKKGRPAFTLSALITPAERDRITDIIFSETTTLGLRLTPTSRETLEREWVETEVEGHRVRMKVGRRGGEVVTTSPEYEDARKVAKATGLPLKKVYELALRALEERSTL